MRIVVFCGQKNSGKDTAAQALMARGWVRLPLAGPLKNMLANLILLRGASEDHVMRMLEGDLKETPSAFLGGKTPRHAMQTLGTEWGRNMLSDTIWLDTWADMTRRLPAEIHGIVVTDCRFANEAAFLQNRGAEVYVIKRPGYTTQAAHASEDLTWAVSYPILWNDDIVEKLHAEVLEAVKP